VDAGAVVEATPGDTSVEVFPAFPPDLPTVVNLGGPVLKNPNVVPIFFANEAPTRVTEIMKFLAALAGSTYWTSVTKEYGVDSLSIATPVMLSENAPDVTDNGTIASWVDAAVAASKLPSPKPASTVYLLYFPETTSITRNGQVSCVGFGGYHNESSEPNDIPYAVVAGCASYSGRLAPGESLHGIDFTTGLTTHELVEAVTDPNIESQPAYSKIDDGKHGAWTIALLGEEIADTCEAQPGAFFMEPTLGYVVQRMYSNAAAKLGHDPCVPHDAIPFFDAYAPDTAITLGGTATIQVELASDAPTMPWTVKVIDWATERGDPPQLSLSLDKTTGKNGDTLSLTVTALSTFPGDSAYILESQLGSVRHRTAGLIVPK
jgi:hypothetical protein